MSSFRRVLVIGPSAVGDMAWFLGLAFRRLGWQVATFDDRRFVGRGLGGSPGKALQLLERDHNVTGRLHKLGRIVRTRAVGCDLAVTVKGEYLLAEDVTAVAERTPFVNWHPDHPVISQAFATVPSYSLFCPKDAWTTERLRDMGFQNVRTLPHGSDPVVLAGTSTRPPGASFSIVGSSYPYRRHWIRLAQEQGLAAESWGFDGARTRAVGTAQGEALRSGCFTLNTHHPFDIAGGNQRVFDAAAAGAAQLTEHLPETLRHFKSGTEIATFQDSSEFVDRVRQLRDDVRLRERLSRESRDRVRDEHTYEHRISTMLGML